MLSMRPGKRRGCLLICEKIESTYLPRCAFPNTMKADGRHASKRRNVREVFQKFHPGLSMPLGPTMQRGRGSSARTCPMSEDVTMDVCSNLFLGIFLSTLCRATSPTPRILGEEELPGLRPHPATPGSPALRHGPAFDERFDELRSFQSLVLPNYVELPLKPSASWENAGKPSLDTSPPKNDDLQVVHVGGIL